MYNIKIINTSNNTRIILTESFRRPVVTNLGVWDARGAQTVGLVSIPNGDWSAGAEIHSVDFPTAPRPNPVGPAHITVDASTSGKTSNYYQRGLTPIGSGQTVNSSKFLFQLTSGQLGFKGATRKSSFVVSKLIQQFFNFIKSRSDNFRNIQFNIYFVGINPKDGVIIDQIRLACGTKFIAAGGGTEPVGWPKSPGQKPVPRPSEVSPRLGISPTTSGRRIQQNLKPAGPGQQTDGLGQAGRGKFYDITPIPFNGCKLKKSRRK